MKILLILPKIFPNPNISYNYSFPLGICYISSAMKEAGHSVKCINLNHHPNAEKLLRDEFKKNYDVIATGSIWMGFLIVREIVKLARLHSPTSKIIIGGTLISSKPELAMDELCPDFGVIGEGEETIIELLDCIENNKNKNKVNGICFMEDKHFIITPPRVSKNNIDNISYPDLESFDFSTYLDKMTTNIPFFQNNIMDYPRTYSILAGRDCPFHCTFCYHPGKYRERKIDSVINEIKWAIKKYNINIINIIDDTFGINKKRIYDFCNRINELNLKWSCQMIVNTIDEELLMKMKESGCYIISYGFESYDKSILKSMKKPITPTSIDFAIKTTMKVGIGIQGNFIFGDIEETVQSAAITLNYWMENCKGQVRLGFIQPYAGSEIYNYCVEKGIIQDEVKYMSSGIWQEVFFNMTKNMSDEEIDNLVKTLTYLRNSGYFSHVFPKRVVATSAPNIYELSVECPYCKKDNIYKNYWFEEDKWYKDYMMCRECKMRYNILKPL